MHGALIISPTVHISAAASIIEPTTSLLPDAHRLPTRASIRESGIILVVSALAGSQAELARTLGIRSQSISICR